MFFYYIKIAFKKLWNNKKYSAINMIGFGFSLSVFLAIILFVMHEMSYDRYHANSKNIYRLIDVSENSSSIDYRVKEKLNGQYAQIENVCLFSRMDMELSVTSHDKGFFINGITSADKAYFEMFDFDFIAGNSAVPFENINSVVLTESSAKHIFGEEDPIGKELILMGNFNLMVSAIIKDFPDNSSFDVGMMVNAENEDFRFEQNIGNSEDLSTYRWPFRIYIQLKNNCTAESLINSVNDNIDLFDPYVAEAGLLPLQDIYLNDPTWGSATKKGSPGLLRLLIAIAAVILIMAIINYVNLSLAQQQKRGKEIGIRKTIGAGRNDLISQFLLECVLVISLAFGFAILLFEFNYPLIKNLLGVSVSLKELLVFPANLYVLAFILLLGVITGIYPALSFSSFNPINIFGKGIKQKGPKKHSRNFLTIFQFMVSITLIFCAIVIWRQIDYTKHKDLGFNKDQLLKIQLPPPMDPSIVSMSNGFINDLRNSQNISHLTPSYGVPGQIFNQMGSGVEGKDQFLAIIYTDTSFLNTFDIKLVEGRKFLLSDEGKSCLLNKTAYEYFGWENLEGKRYENGGGFDVVGVVEDFHIGSLHSPIQPTAIIFDTDNIQHLSIKLNGDKIGETMQFIRDTWQKDLAEFPLGYSFYDDWFNSMYEKEERFGRIISYFTVLGIIISCIGIFGLAIFNAERKTKEIGIRKVNGATVKNVLLLLTKEYTLWVMVAFLVASPIAYFLMNKWLQAFAYRTEISWVIFALTGIFAVVIAWMSVIWQSLKAAYKDPVEVLRYE